MAIGLGYLKFTHCLIHQEWISSKTTRSIKLETFAQHRYGLIRKNKHHIIHINHTVFLTQKYQNFKIVHKMQVECFSKTQGKSQEIRHVQS